MSTITNVRELVRKHSGPLATVYCCPYCNFVKRVRKAMPGGMSGGGRGSGLRNGSINQAAVVAHIKEAHADKLAAGGA